MMEQLNSKRAHFNSRLLTETNNHHPKNYDLPTAYFNSRLLTETNEKTIYQCYDAEDFNSRLLTETNSEKNQYA